MITYNTLWHVYKASGYSEAEAKKRAHDYIKLQTQFYRRVKK